MLIKGQYRCAAVDMS